MRKGAQLRKPQEQLCPAIGEQEGGGKGQLQKISELLSLYFSLEATLQGLPERQLEDTAGALRALASRASMQEQAINELALIRSRGVSGPAVQEQGRGRGLERGEVRWSRPLRIFSVRRSLPLFWETAAFLLGLAIAFLLT